MRNTHHLRIKLAAAALAAAPAVLAPQAQAQLASLPLPVTTNVTVTNPTLNVHSVDNHAVNSFAENSAPICAASGASLQLGAPSSGSGETLVLEMVTVQFRMSAGAFPAQGVAIGAIASTGPYTLSIPATLQGSDGVNNYYVASQALKAYSSGSAVSVSVNAGKNSGFSGTPEVCIDNFAISGYLQASH